MLFRDSHAGSPVAENARRFISKISFTQLVAKFPQSFNVIFNMIDDSETLNSLVLESIVSIDLLKIESIKRKEEIECFLNLFTQMKDLELSIQSDTLDVVTAFQIILTNHSKKTSNLRSICFDDVKVDRDVLTNSRMVINDNLFVPTYTFRCVNIRIYVMNSN